MLKIENVDFNNGILTIPSFVAKNHNERSLGIPDEIMAYFKSIEMMPSDVFNIKKIIGHKTEVHFIINGNLHKLQRPKK